MASVPLTQLPPQLVACVDRAVVATLKAVTGDSPVARPDGSQDSALTCDGVIGVISLVGEVEWSLVLGLPPATAPVLAERFAGFPIPLDSPDIGDAIGELTNLVAGETKVELDREGVRANISLPQVLRGTGVELLGQLRSPCLILTYDHACGPLRVAVAAGRSQEDQGG